MMRAISLLAILSTLVPSEARVGSGPLVSEQQQQQQEVLDKSLLKPVSRKLGGGYGSGRPNHGGQYFKPKHNGHWDYYYIKRPADPSEYYHNWPPAPTPTGSPPETNRPTEPPKTLPVVTSSPYSPTDEVEIPLFVPATLPPTESPVVPPTLPPTETPVPPPTLAPVPEPTLAPVEPEPVVIDIGLVTEDDSDKVTLKPDGNETDQQTTITLEPPTLIQARLSVYALDGGIEFEDPTSYQFAALKRVEAQAGVEEFSDSKLVQYFALYCIFAATNAKLNDQILQARAFGDLDGDAPIPGWRISSGWLETEVDPCLGEWYGVSCVDDQIVNLDLFDNGLTGNFPPEVVLLAGDGAYSNGAGSLVSLDIFNNQLMSNNGDNSWIADLGSQLGYLYLQNTGFTGKLPPKFPEGLVELDIANSMITGDLQGAAFENLTSLRFLLMDGVQFDSSIPSEIAKLPNLEYLFATDSMITGDLSYMESMPVIFEHWVDRNPLLGGTIPSFLGSLTSLQSFSIAECSFTGTIPESLGNLGLMQQMWLYGNQLSGEIPASIGKLSFMRIFEVEENNLSDSMPQSVCDNFSTGMLEILGADCDKLDCPCCTCCSVQECRDQN